MNQFLNFVQNPQFSSQIKSGQIQKKIVVIVSIDLKSFLHLHLLPKICERVRRICTVDKMCRVYHLDKDKGFNFTFKQVYSTLRAILTNEYNMLNKNKKTTK